ncbi:unnamed protein product [Rotaria sp. Silwood1]|nr:unnamed protein product [Rotaria sp. Silwood1]
MEVNPANASNPVASMQNISFFPAEKEILFSMNMYLDIYLNKLPDCDQDLSGIYLNIGQTYQGQGQHDQTLETFQYVLNKALQLRQSQYKLMSTLYCSIEEILCYQEKFDEALKNYNVSLKIRLENFSSIDPSIAETNIGIGEVYEFMEDFNQAFIHYEKVLEIQQRSLLSGKNALQIQEKFLSKDSLELEFTNKLLGDALKLMKDDPRALSYYQKAIESEQKAIPSDYLSIHEIYYETVKTLDHLQRYKEAIEYAEQTYHTRCDTLGSQHPNVTEIQEYVDKLKKKN